MYYIVWWKTEEDGDCRSGVLGVFSTIEGATQKAEAWMVSQEGNWDEHAASVTTTWIDCPQNYLHPNLDTVWMSE